MAGFVPDCTASNPSIACKNVRLFIVVSRSHKIVPYDEAFAGRCQVREFGGTHIYCLRPPTG